MMVGTDALNYPYIRVRRADWLKRTLLVFPHVVRMAPNFGPPMDDPEIEPFTRTLSGLKPLLRSAELFAAHVERAQRKLIERIQVRLLDDPSFEARFGRSNSARVTGDGSSASGVWRDRVDLSKGFQIHGRKLLPELADFLLRRGLAWIPDNSHGDMYIELSRPLGEAVMATLAFACAENEGLQLVTEFPDIHGRIIDTKSTDIFNTILDEGEEGGHLNAREVIEFIIYRRCNVDKLTPEVLSNLRHEREAISAFRSEMELLAKRLPDRVMGERHREEMLADSVNDILSNWKKNYRNTSPYIREIFGSEALDEPKMLLKGVIDKALHPVSTAGIGGLTTLSLSGAAAGFAVGFAVHTLKAAARVRTRQKTGPLRYLTTLERAGVGIVVTA